MPYHRSTHRSCEPHGTDLEQSVEAVAELVSQTVLRLTRECPADSRGVIARDALMDLRPRVHEALEALEDLKDRRNLTDEEHARRHAFVTLLCAKV